MNEKSDKRLNELEAKYSFQEDSLERLSDEVRKQQQEIFPKSRNRDLLHRICAPQIHPNQFHEYTNKAREP